MKKKGFTLVEILICITITGIVVIPMVNALIKLRRTYTESQEDMEVQLYGSIISREINNDIINENGVNDLGFDCEDNICTFTLNSGKSRKIVLNKHVNETNDSGMLLKSIYSTVEYYECNDANCEDNDLLLIKTIVSKGKYGADSVPIKQHYYHFDNIVSQDIPLGGGNLRTMNLVATDNNGNEKPEYSIKLYSLTKSLETVGINQFRVVYHPNGASGMMHDTVCTYNTDCELKSNIFNSNYYTFKEWNTSQDGSGEVYENSSTINKSTVANNEMVLYAIWEPKTYTISYNANGGSGVPSSQTKTYGVNLTLSSTVPTRSGHVFLGWSTSSAATTATYGAGGTYTANSGATLYAVWQLNPIKITYNCNGSGGTDPTALTCIPGSCTLTGASTCGNTSIKRGTEGWVKKFLGWSTSKGVTTATYTGGDSYNGTSSVTLYAVYEKMFTYSGNYTVCDDSSCASGTVVNNNWRIKFLSSGTYTPTITPYYIDIFAVGGGGSGGGIWDCDRYASAGGGGSGYANTHMGAELSNISYFVEVGAGGKMENAPSYDDYNGTRGINGESSSFGSFLTAAGGHGAEKQIGNKYATKGGAGGCGGGGGTYAKHQGGNGGSNGSSGLDGSNTGSPYNGSGGAGSGNSMCEFGVSSCPDDLLYGGGGSGGAAKNSSNEFGEPGVKGKPHGGTGGKNGNGENGDENTGGGGGGASACKNSGRYKGGDGGSGIVVIRNAR